MAVAVAVFVSFATQPLITTATYMKNHTIFALSNIALRCDKMCIEQQAHTSHLTLSVYAFQYFAFKQ